jgi:hypothetical protein
MEDVLLFTSGLFFMAPRMVKKNMASFSVGLRGVLGEAAAEEEAASAASDDICCDYQHFE